MNQKPTYEELEIKVKEFENIFKALIPDYNSSFEEQIKNYTDAVNFVKSMDIITATFLQSKDLDKVIEDALDAIFSIFKSDRIWLFYPCDPDAQTFRVLSEKSKQEYPGAFISGQELTVTPQAKKTIQKAIDSESPVVFDSESGNVLDDVAKKYSVQSQIIMAVRPKIGKPWMLGMHQCSYARIWNKYEQKLFKEISYRVVDNLSNIVLLKNLEQSEQKFRSVLDNASAVIFIKDLDGKYLYINSLFEKLHGITCKKILGLTDYDVFSFDLAEQFRNNDINVLKNSKSINVEELVPHEDGVHTFISTKFPLLNKNREPYAICGIATDITERILVEEALNENERRYKSAQRLGRVGNWEYNLVTEEFWGSDEAKRIYGFNPKNQKFTTEEVESCIHEREMVHQSLVDLINKNKEYNLEFEIFPIDGSKKRIIKSIAEVIRTESGTPLKVVGVIQDITEQKEAENERLKLEKQLKHVQKLESIGTLAGGIAHDFNNILSVITGNISYALSNFNKNEKMFEVLSDVQTGAMQAKKLTQQLLTFAKGGDPIKQPLNLNQLVQESAKFITSGSKSKCEFDLADDLWICEIDFGQINQVISNIVINADQSMPKGGIIKIKTENITKETGDRFSLPSGRYVKVSILDQGIGIQKNHLSNIFDLYFTTKQKGTGLGLATSYSIIKKHDGFIDVYSEVEKGTVFNIYFPASSKSSQIVLKGKERKYTGSGKILIMDDQEQVLKMAERMLEQMGYQISIARDGTEAVNLYIDAYQLQETYDLVILDLTVPGGMGGERTMKELLKIDSKVKAVVSSGYSNDHVMSNYKDYGFLGGIPKPYTKNQMAEVLNKILS